jgi:hypothetical protein
MSERQRFGNSAALDFLVSHAANRTLAVGPPVWQPSDGSSSKYWYFWLGSCDVNGELHADQITVPDGESEHLCLAFIAELTAHPPLVTAWHGGGRKPIEHRVTAAGQIHPDRDDLPDRDEDSRRSGLSSAPEDLWKDTRYLYLINQHGRQLHLRDRRLWRPQRYWHSQVQNHQHAHGPSRRGANG